MQQIPRVLVVLLLVGFLPSALLADDGNDASVKLDLGAVSFANSGSEEAQAPFLRGLAALHSFWYDEAADAFNEAQEIDPGFALAYWGEAMTHHHPLWNQHDKEAGRAVLERLGSTPEERLAKAPTEREKGYLRGAEAIFGDGELDERRAALAEVLRELHEAHPDDVDAAAFYALALLGKIELGVDLRGAVRAAAVLESWFDRVPRHPGVLHYLIHAYDDAVHAPLGLRPAQLYAKAAPASAHALHMPAHIFLQLGMWDDAAASNEEAYQASIDIAERKGRGPGSYDHHSFFWLQYVYLQQGRFGDARRLLDELGGHLGQDENEPRYVKGTYENMVVRYVVETERFGELDELLARIPENENGRRDFLLGMAAVARGERKKARKLAERLTERSGESEAEGSARARYEKVWHHVILGLVEAAKESPGKARAEAAVEHLRAATALIDETGLPIGPPGIFKPPHEYLGETLLRLGRPREAAEVFDASLERSARRRLSLLGRLRAARALDDAEGIRKYSGMLADVLHRADEGVDGE